MGEAQQAPRSKVHGDDGLYVVRVSPLNEARRSLRYRVDAYYRGKRTGTLVQETFSGASAQDAAAEFAGILWMDYATGAHVHPPARPHTLGELLARFLERTTSKKGRPLSPRTMRAYESHTSGWLAVAGAQCPLSLLTAAQVEDAIERPASPVSQQQYLTSIRAVIRWGVREGFLSEDITARLQADPGDHRMRPYLQPPDWYDYLEQCAPAWQIRAGLILETGLRAAEAAHLHWSWVHRGVGMGTIQVPGRCPVTGFRSKARRRRTVPLSDAAAAWLADAEARWGTDGFVLHDRPAPLRTDNWRRASRSACERAGLEAVDTHGLRRSAGVRWLSVGLSIYDVSRLLGHSSVEVTERSYADIAHGHLAEAIAKVNAASRATQLRRPGAWSPGTSKTARKSAVKS